MFKNIYTSNYARCGENPNAAGISCSCPQWFSGPRIPSLAPAWSMVDSIKKGKMSRKQYTTKYLALLQSRGLTPELIYNNLADGTILLCYESPYEFCHRRILAEWITHHTGISIPEWKTPKELAEEEKGKFVDSVLNF